MVNPGAFRGARKEFLMKEKAVYSAGVAGGYAADALAQIQRRYFKRFPIDLPHDEEPSAEDLEKVDDDAADPEPNIVEPDLERLSKEEFAALMDQIESRKKLLHFRKAQIKRWMAYQYMKDNDLNPKDSGVYNPYHSLMLKLTGKEVSRPHCKTGVNMWRKTHREEIETELKRRLGNLKGKRDQLAAERDRIAREMFSKLDQEEQRQWKHMATAEHDELMQQYRKDVELASSPSDAPEDRQRCIEGLVRFLEPIMDMVCACTGWSSTVMVGGPEPAQNSQLNIISIHSGTTSGEIKMNFGRAERERYKRYFVPIFGSFLQRCFTPDECRARALSTSKGHLPLLALDMENDNIIISSYDVSVPLPPINGVPSALNTTTSTSLRGDSSTAPIGLTSLPRIISHAAPSTVNNRHAAPSPPPLPRIVSDAPSAMDNRRTVHSTTAAVTSSSAVAAKPAGQDALATSSCTKSPPASGPAHLSVLSRAPSRAPSPSQAPFQAPSTVPSQTQSHLQLPVSVPVPSQAPLPAPSPVLSPVPVPSPVPLPVPSPVPLPVPSPVPLPVPSPMPLPVQLSVPSLVPALAHSSSSSQALATGGNEIPNGSPVMHSGLDILYKGIALSESPRVRSPISGPNQPSSSTSPPHSHVPLSDLAALPADISATHGSTTRAGTKRSLTTEPPINDDQHSKRRKTGKNVSVSVTTSTTSPFIAADDAPRWFKTALSMVYSVDLGPEWQELVHKLEWATFEVKEHYKEVAKLGNLHRPASVKDWIQRGQSPTWRPTITNLPKYGKDFLKWWTTLQPAWRISSEGAIMFNVMDGDWAPLRRPGTNGLLSVIGCLFHWGTALQKNKKAVKSQWLAAVRNCSTVYSHLLEN